jgi:DnaJ-class molecular chaperone
MNQNTYATLYDKLTAARTVLGLGEEATLDEIKRTYRTLIRRWHPDKACGDSKTHHDKSRAIIHAYKAIMDYCKEYKISFSRETVNRYRSDEEFWRERFGNDPMWGGGA